MSKNRYVPLIVNRHYHELLSSCYQIYMLVGNVNIFSLICRFLELEFMFNPTNITLSYLVPSFLKLVASTIIDNMIANPQAVGYLGH